MLALEVLINNAGGWRDIIRDAKTYMLPGIIQTGRKQGMMLMDESLRFLVGKGLISPDEAISRAAEKADDANDARSLKKDEG